MNITEQLKEPFNPKVVHWRTGATNFDKKTGALKFGKEPQCIPLAYIDARDVMKRLDDVCGDEWQVRYPFPGCCEVGIKIDGEWLWRGNGAGETDIEGEKGQYSDAFKRAAVLWGVGRYLYYLPSNWVPCDLKGKFIAPALPEWAKPGFRRFNKGERDAIYTGVMSALEQGDRTGLKEIYDEYCLGEQEEAIKFWAIFNSSETSAIKALLDE